MEVERKYALIKAKIEEACKNVNRNTEEIKVVAVTKYVSTQRAKEALEAGIEDFGENRDDGLIEKWEVLGNQPVWHFIGTLQTRKVRNVIDKVSYIHSLDRLSLAKEIDKRTDRRIKCFVQVNVSGEESKHGLDAEKVIPFIKELEQHKNILVVGLMTMAPHTKDEQVLRSCFRRLKSIQEEIKNLNLEYAPCDELSMGMSNDYIIAIEEGATFIRIGTALVGEEIKEA
ncbi:YggS family pyridoxal phosphate-dependent enzyme [Pseudogracilibacillus auburnensis]|uniref:YggS family pyridoxal phosphate-dependent enzyme n=1 Tax=Pseudogracilibacillus auburnensis TaxID=1494959 RepID=UPI001A96291E|nr:YggS family pyridoxal phosphate-dependent enzyme [Pseudogracilibacillus auburnensis]MBO1004948.1 YggS family pyridoxal phosphate-dependent enzyme [Pseudogracilibacillus auburnensis]